MSGFMKYLNKINFSLIEESKNSLKDEENEEVVEQPKVVKKTVPVKKNIPQKVDTSVSILEDRIRTKLDDIGLNSKLINEVVSFVLDDVSSVPNLKISEGKQVNTSTNNKPKQPASVDEFKIRNDIRGAAEFLLEGVPEMSSPGRVVNSTIGGDVIKTHMSSVADHASSLL